MKAKQKAIKRVLHYESQMRQSSNRPASPCVASAHDSGQPYFANSSDPYLQTHTPTNEDGYYDSGNPLQEHVKLRHDVPPPPSPKRHTENARVLETAPSPPRHSYNPHVIDNRPVSGHNAMAMDEFVPMDEAIDFRARGCDPPEDEPPSLRKMSQNGNGLDRIDTEYYVTPMNEEPRSPVTDDFVSPVSMETYDEAIPSPDMGRPPKKVESDRSKAASPAMRGAQEMLKRNRQRRSQESAKRKDGRETRKGTTDPEKSSTNMYASGGPAQTPKSPESGTTWETGSDTTSIDGSSTWTDDNNPDRSSRRALILQMAKARMRNNQHLISSEEGPLTAESREMEEEKKHDVGQPYDIDLTGDLD